MVGGEEGDASPKEGDVPKPQLLPSAGSKQLVRNARRPTPSASKASKSSLRPTNDEVEEAASREEESLPEEVEENKLRLPPLPPPAATETRRQKDVPASSNALSTPQNAVRNGWLEDILPHLNSFVDAEAILLLRQTCSLLYKWRWKSFDESHQPRPLRFSAFRGFDGQLLCDKLIRSTLASLSQACRCDGVLLDLSHCVMVRDTQLAFLGSAGHCFVPNPQPENRAMYTKLVGLKLDFCTHLSDKGFSALLSAHLPHLSSLSLKCLRSETFSGQSLRDAMAEVLWPRFKHLIADFTSISLDAVTEVARFIARPPTLQQPPLATPMATHLPPPEMPVILPEPSVSTLTALTSSVQCTFDSMPSQPLNTHPRPLISFVGSAASKAYLELIGAKHLIKALAMALNSGDPEKVSETAKQADVEIDSLLLKRMSEHDDPIAAFVIHEGSRYLVNVPVTCPTSEEGGVNVWTLPISVAVLNGKLDMVTALVEAGAELDVVDHLGKSPLYRAVSSGNYEMTRFIIECGVQLNTLNVLTQPPLNVAIEHKDHRLTKLLLEAGYSLNLRCPAIKTFKSPLHVACEIGDEEIIHSLLDWGSNPNTFSGTYKNSPAMIAYRANPRFLPVFLQGGPAGHFTSLALASEILTAAIAKNDVRSAELLVTLFPSLLTRQHPTWSLPHIQASKTGKVEVLEAILAANLSVVVADKVAMGGESAACGALHYFGHPSGCCVHTHRSRSTLMREMADPTTQSPRDQLSKTTGPRSQQLAAGLELFPISSPARIQQDRVGTDQPDETASLFASDSNKPLPQASFVSDRRDKVRLWARKSTGEQSGILQRNSKEHLTGELEGKIAEENDAAFSRPCSDMAEFLSTRDVQTGNTALHYTAEDGRMDCLKVLLRYGADIDVLNNVNQTPLHLACLEDRQEVVELLVYLGCQMCIRDSVAQETPLMTAIKARHDEIAMILLKHQAHRESHGLFEFPDDDNEEVESNNTDLTERRRQSPLEYALYFGRYEIAQKLMSREKNLNELFENEEALKSTYATVCERLQGADAKRLQARKVLQRFVRLYGQIKSPSSRADNEVPVVSDLSSQSDGDNTQPSSGNNPGIEAVPCLICSVPSNLVGRNYSFCLQCHYDCIKCRRQSVIFHDPQMLPRASDCPCEEGSESAGHDSKTRTRARRLQGRIKLAAKLLFQRNKSNESP